MATKCKYYHYHYRGWGMRSLCFFYKILWLIGPQSATKHSPWLALLIAISQEILSVSKWMEIWFYCELVLCLFAKDLTLYDQNCRTKSIVELSNSQLGTWIPPKFILCLDFKLNSANNRNTFIVPNVSQLHFFLTEYLFIYFLNM